MKEFTTIKDTIQAEIIEKKSKFIANLFYVESAEQAEDIIKETKKRYHDARHNCVAYRIIEDEKIVEKASDDGEPSGTAGMPMLQILKSNNLANVLVIVTRYFGGILLGTGGLVRAYSNSLIKAIEKSQKQEKCLGVEVELNIEYPEFENFKYYCKKNKINIINTNYSENIVCTIELEESKKQKLLEDYREKKINISKINDLSIKYINKV
mgnify:CR=1 FL=1